MAGGDYIFYNGTITRTAKLYISPDNRSFRYGDGFFETMKMVNGKIMLDEMHLDRLFNSLHRMHFQRPDYFTADYILDSIQAVARKNYHDKLVRVRFTVFRGDGGLYDVNNHFPHHLVQTWPLDAGNQSFNKNGLTMDIFPDARKTCDQYSSIKTNNYLPSAMGALWARHHKLDDVLLLNPYDRIADATIANVFIIQDGIIKTPPLDEGAINGVMRRHLLECLRLNNITFEVKPLTPDDVLNASEVFLTNAVFGIRWVQRIGDKVYDNTLSNSLYHDFISGQS
jgi:branched-subunit amino acid aminotransferase/4-amino-4-deoxychorismate lyase